MNLTPYLNDMIWAGINPPTDGRKTTCPQCSKHRTKPREKCLGLFETSKGIIAKCYHCEWEIEFT